MDGALDEERSVSQSTAPPTEVKTLPEGGGDVLTYVWSEIRVRTPGIQPAQAVFAEDGKKKGGLFSRKPRISKEVIKGVSGVAYPYEALAIMGSSGAGKTTLLNVLTGSKSGGLHVHGDRMINGEIATSEMLSAVSGYVHQDDLFIPSLTVREHMNFVAKTRMPRTTRAQRQQRVNEVLQELGLLKCAESRIGDPGRIKGISGGEMRRLSFASEILTDPPILFCDEPTSGLDSYMSLNIVQIMKDLAKKGKTIICTIHQPSSQVYEMFDKVCYMTDGRMAYLGELSGAEDFLRSIGHSCPQNFNPSDFIIDLLAIHPDHPEESRKLSNEVCDAFEKSEYNDKIKAAVSKAKALSADPRRCSVELGTEECLAHKKVSRGYKTSWCDQFAALLWRSFLSALKDPSVLAARLVTTIAFASLIGGVFWRQKMDQEGVLNINGSLFLISVSMSLQNCFSVANVLCTEMPIFYRENSEGMYRSEAYLLAKTIAEFPMFLLIPIIFSVITWYMIGYNDDDFHRFLMFTLTLILVCNVSVSFGYLLAIACGHLLVTLVVLPMAVLPSIIFSGFVVVPSGIVGWLRWFHYCSWFFYSWEVMAVNQWRDNGNILCAGGAAGHCLDEGKHVLEKFELEKDNVLRDCLILLGMAVGFRVVAWAVLALRARLQRS